MEPLQLARPLVAGTFFSPPLAEFGMVALAELLADEGRGRSPVVNPFEPKTPHFPAKAKNVIFLYMEGAPSQIDLFDPKPELTQMAWSASAAIHDEGPEVRLY